MDKWIVIGVIVCFFPFIAFYPTEIPPAQIENITSSTRSDWGGDQSSYEDHCGNSIGWFEWTDNLTGEVWYDFVGGCNI